MKFLGNINPRKSVAVDFTTATEESRKLYWDDASNTLSLEMGNGVVQQIGFEQYEYGKNNTASDIINGTVVMQTGAVGLSGLKTIAPANGSGTYDASTVIGIATEAIPVGEDGIVTCFGLVRGLDTTGVSYGETWVNNDTLYINPSTPGRLTNIKPLAPNLKVVVGHVIHADATDGTIFVDVNHGSYLGQTDHNVEIVNLANHNVLRFNSSNKRWENIAQTDLELVASQVEITDSGEYFTGTEVESALQQAGSELAEFKRNLYNTMSTGVLSFAGITKVDDTHFNVGACYGYIVDNETDPINPTMVRVSYNGETNLTTPYLTTADQTQIFLKSDGTLFLTDLNPAPPNYVREMILLGRVIHNDKTIIRAVETGTFVASSVYSNLRDIWLAVGPINSGVYVYPNGANLNLSLHGGGLFYGGLNIQNSPYQVNKLNIPSQTLLSFGYRTRGGEVVPEVTAVTPNYWDNNGVITLITGLYKKSTNQRVFLTRSGIVRIQYGQTLYNSFAEAIGGISTEPFVVAETLKTNAVLIGILTMENATTALNAATGVRFTPVSKFGEISGGGGSGAAVNAPDVAVADAGGYYDGSDVETILQEIGYSLNNIVNINTKTVVVEGTAIDVTNSYDAPTDTYTYTVSHQDTSTLEGKQGSTGIKSVTVDGLGHVTDVETDVYLTKESFDYKNIIVTDNDSGFTWSDTGSVVATQTSDTVTFVNGGGTEVDVDSTAKAVKFSHADTSSVSNIDSDNSNGVVIQDFVETFDTYGHVQTVSVVTTDLDNRYYTETEIDANLLNYQLRSEKAKANGYAPLDENKLIPTTHLPSYVDDVIEGYYFENQFYQDFEHTKLITPEGGKIYVSLDTNKTYRWSGSTYVYITSGAVDSVDGQTGIVNLTNSYEPKNANIQTHIASTANPHSVTKKQVGLEFVDNESKATMFTNPEFTGIPTAPTAVVNTDTTQIATTAFVNAEIANDAAPLSHVGSRDNAHDVVTQSENGFMIALDKKKLDGIAEGAEVNVNADWNATSGDAEILHKPTTLEGYGIIDAAPLDSPALIGVPTAPTAEFGTDTTQIATTEFVQNMADSLLDSVPEDLNTLNKLSAAINNDPNYYSTVNTALGTKLDVSVYEADHPVVTRSHNNFGIATGTNDYTVTLDPAPTAYSPGMIVSFLVQNANTSGCTLDCNGLGLKNIYQNVTEKLTSQTFLPNQVVSVIYDGNNFQIISGSGGSGGGGGVAEPQYTRTVIDTATNTVPIGYADFDDTHDILFVYQNSVYIAGQQDYVISGTNIVKTSGTWAAGTTFDFVCFVTFSDTSNYYLSRAYTFFTAPTDGTTACDIGFPAFDRNKDILTVYYQNLTIFEDTDYNIAEDNSKVNLTSFSLNAGEVLRFQILKKVREYKTQDYSQFIDAIPDVDAGGPSSNYNYLLNHVDGGTSAYFADVYTPINAGGVS